MRELTGTLSVELGLLSASWSSIVSICRIFLLWLVQVLRKIFKNIFLYVKGLAASVVGA